MGMRATSLERSGSYMPHDSVLCITAQMFFGFMSQHCRVFNSFEMSTSTGKEIIHG